MMGVGNVAVHDQSQYSLSLTEAPPLKGFAECGSTLKTFAHLDFPSRKKQREVPIASPEPPSLEETLSSLNTGAEIPPFDNLLHILQNCRKKQSLPYINCMHQHLCSYGLESHSMLGNHIVPVFVDCGSVLLAHQAFHKLTLQSEHSWTSLVRGYVKCGQLQSAFGLYSTMEVDFVQPSTHTYVAILQACTDGQDLERGAVIHSEIAKKGLEGELFIGNTLVDMYAKCGAMPESQKVFDELPDRDVVSWNALLTGYAESGLSEEVLKCLHHMQLEGVSPDAVTIVCSLKVYGGIGATIKGLEVHSNVAQEGFETDMLIGNTLVDMYAKFGLFFELQEVFNDLQAPDVVSWTNLIGGYCEHGRDQEALDWVEKMQQEGILMNATTYVFGLKACGNVGAIDKGREMHMDIMKHGFDTDYFTGNTLVDLYAKCGLLEDAEKSFDQLPAYDVVSWNSIIAGYAEHGLCHEALKCLEKMESEGFSPNAVTYICLLKMSGIMTAINEGQVLHSEIACRGFERDHSINHALVEMYSRCGVVAEALKVLDENHIISWNAFISRCADQGLGEEALHAFQKLQSKGMSPDAFTYISTVKACSNIKASVDGYEMHIEITKRGYERDAGIAISLISMYGKCGLLVDSEGVFVKLGVPNSLAWNALIAGYTEQGLGDEAQNVMEHMQLLGTPPTIISCSLVLAGHAEHGHTEVVFKLYEQSQEQGLLPDSAVFISILKACGNSTALGIGKKVHTCCPKNGRHDGLIGLSLHNALLDMYCKCGSMADAQETFNRMPTQIVTTWNIMIAGYARQGQSRRVFETFERMRTEGVKPDDVTFLSILSLCVHAGLLEKGQEYFEIMSMEYGISPTSKNLNCMVDLFGRSGQVEEAATILEKAPSQFTLMGWLTLLGACHKWGNLELGRRAFDWVMSFDSQHVPACVLISNIYTDAEMWEDAQAIDATSCMSLPKDQDCSIEGHHL